MQSRYPKHIEFDYCLSPQHFRDGDKDVVVPCGHCAGCLVHKANAWSQRLGMEISACPNSIAVTPTYNNYFLPKLVERKNHLGLSVWTSSHRFNWYHAGSRCSLRDDDINIVGNYSPVAVTNFDSFPTIPYASKRDIQLWLKRIRRKLDDYKNLIEDGQKYFRYFIISEYGETKFRPHYHCIFFCTNKEVTELLCTSLFYETWQMCDKDRFQQYIEHCNSSASNYLTTYVNSITRIPEVYKNDEIRPFRLASKSPAIGYMSYNRDEIREKIVQGTLEYTRRIEKLTDRYILRYSKDYLSSRFPKCKGYGKKSFDELLFTYGFLYRCSRIPEQKQYQRYGFNPSGLSEVVCSSDFNASRKCLQVCNDLGCTPFHYLYLLDMVWYLNDMYALHMFYKYQEKRGNDLFCMSLYSNLGDWLTSYSAGNVTQLQIMMLDFFFEGYGIDSLDIKNYSPQDFLCFSQPSSDYVKELEDIMSNMVKMPKLNESLGTSPVNQFT